MKSWLLLSLAVLGCSESVESTDVKTTGVYPEFVVTADGTGSSTIEAWLKVGGNNSNTFLELKAPDVLQVTVNGETIAVDEHKGDKYTARVNTDAAGTEFSFAFLRGGDGDAPASKVTLPAPFAMEMVTLEAIRGTDGVTFNWTPPQTSGDMEYEFDGDCIFEKSGKAPDSVGTYTVKASEISELSAQKDQACTVSVVLTRKNSGSIDPAFTEGGEISARQVRKAAFLSKPAPPPVGQ
jgi:hypothetical protein